MKDKIIDKQDELIEYYEKPKEDQYRMTIDFIKSEIASLKQGEGKGETCKCTYPRPSTYGGEGIRTCVDCNKYIESPEKKPTDEEMKVKTGCSDYILHKECPMFEIKGRKACNGCPASIK